MKKNIHLLTALCLMFCGFFHGVHAEEALNPNQTQDVSPIYPEFGVPFILNVVQAGFSLPSGIQSYVSATYKGKWLLLAGRTNGLHDFNNDDNNFPPNKQNTTIYVVDPVAKTVFYRSLSDPKSGLTQAQIDLLSVTSAQFYQHKKTLYITGGYGVDTATGQFSTKDTLTALNIPEVMDWVVNSQSPQILAKSIRTISDPVFQVTGGYMSRTLNGLTLLVFGQNFVGFYNANSNGFYTQQVRRFKIRDDGTNLSVKVKHASNVNANYRRRDLNVVPIMRGTYGLPVPAFIAFSGVFTTEGGIWTVPVLITSKGWPSMKDPFTDPDAFKQGMNNYAAPTIGLYSEKQSNMFVSILGGISYETFENGVFQPDTEIPFTNQITTVRFDENDNFTQFLMNAQYPFIASTQSNPGNQLLFGAGAQFFPENLPAYENGVIKFDKLSKEPIFLGYVVGGIQSTLPNTNTGSDSAASPYIFQVFMQKTPLR